MTERSLQVTYRKGRPFAAYLHLSHHTGEKSARTVPSHDGLLVVETAAKVEPAFPLELVTSRRYGAARLTLYRHP